MRDVMIRNTRSQVDVRAPGSHGCDAAVGSEREVEEASCYQELSRLIQEVPKATAHIIGWRCVTYCPPGRVCTAARLPPARNTPLPRSKRG